MRQSRWLVPSVIVAVAALVAAACGGGGNPASPSGTRGVVLQGTVLGAASASGQGAEVAAQGASPGRITVTVQQDTSITTTVSGNGTFQLEGVPEGGFTLVFSTTTTTLGTITIPAVGSNGQINIVVEVTTTTVVLVQIEVEDNDDDSNGNGDPSCFINGGRAGKKIELEGTVGSVNGSAFTLNVNGNRASGPVNVETNGAQVKCKDDENGCTIATGQQVHVKGTLLSCDASATTHVSATEVKVQKDKDKDKDKDDDSDSESNG